MSSPIALQHVRPVEQPRDLAAEAAVAHVGVVEDVVERAAAVVLADHVGGDPLLVRTSACRGTRRCPERTCDRPHGGDCILVRLAAEEAGRPVRRARHRGRRRRRRAGADRDLDRAQGGRRLGGRPGGQPAAPAERRAAAGDYVFEGYELQDALDAANESLEDDVSVSEQDGPTTQLPPFKRAEVLGPLERWFFGRS